MRFFVVLCTLLALSAETEFHRTPRYRRALRSVSDSISITFNNEYRKYVRSGVKSTTLQQMTSYLKAPFEYRRKEIEDIPVREQDLTCILCRSAVGVLLKYRREGKSEEFLFEIANDLCTTMKLAEPDVCAGLIERNLPILVFIIDNRPKLTEHSVCGLVLQGSSCEFDDDSFDWQVEIDNNMPTLESHKEEPIDEEAEKLTIIQISDVHYDPSYQTGALADCKKPVCCRSDSENHIDMLNGAGKWGDYRSCDVPWYLYEQSLNQIKKVHKKIDMIYFTGDIIDHAVWNTSFDGNTDSIKRVNNLMKAYFPDVPTYPILGNHEANPLNVFAPDYIEEESLSTKWLYELIAEQWADWLPAGTLTTIKKGGFYTVVPRKGFRIIALNNNDCYAYNFWILFDPAYIAQQLKWLHDTLLEAEAAGERVHILAHIPAGEGSCFNVWSREFRRIIDRFYRTISAIFNGHTHNDELEIYFSKTQPSYAVNVGWNGGSLTPFSFVNPNYRIYTVETNTYQVVEHDTWIFNLTLANLTPDEEPVWFKEYSFKYDFGIENLTPAGLVKFVQKLSKDRESLTKYWRYKMKSGDASLAQGCDDKCLEKHLCEIVVTQANDRVQCEIFKPKFGIET